MYLYRNGNEYSSITGGWTFNRGNIDEGHATMTKGSTSLNFSLDGGYASGYGYCTVGTNTAVDLSGYKTLRFRLPTRTGSGEIFVRGRAIKSGNVVATADWSGEYITVDVSSVTGYCTVGIQFQLGGNKAIHWNISMSECVLLS